VDKSFQSHLGSYNSSFPSAWRMANDPREEDVEKSHGWNVLGARAQPRLIPLSDGYCYHRHN
jgi:hypothetical protein